MSTDSLLLNFDSVSISCCSGCGLLQKGSPVIPVLDVERNQIPIVPSIHAVDPPTCPLSDWAKPLLTVAAFLLLVFLAFWWILVGYFKILLFPGSLDALLFPTVSSCTDLVSLVVVILWCTIKNRYLVWVPWHKAPKILSYVIRAIKVSWYP